MRREGGPGADLPAVVRLALRLFPPDHRRRYGGEMEEVALHEYRRAHERAGPVGRAALASKTALTLTWQACLQWMTTWRKWTVEKAGDPLAGLRLDLAFVLRSLCRSPAFSLSVLGVIATVVALVSAGGGFIRGTLLRPPPYPEPERVVIAWGSHIEAGRVRDVVSGPNFVDLARRATTVDHLSALVPEQVVLTGAESPVGQSALAVTADFFSVLGVEAARGRLFDERDRTSSGPPVVVVSHGFWTERRGGAGGAVGASLSVGGIPHTVVGVLPEDFEFVLSEPLYLPLREDLLASDERTRHHYWLLGRLSRGATEADATAELSRLLAEIAEDHPVMTGWRVLVERLDRVSVAAVRPFLLIVAGALVLILLVAAANLANLHASRASARADELALRVALGADVRALVRLVTLEGAVLGLVAGVAGVGLAAWLLEAAAPVVPRGVPIPGSATVVPALRSVLDPAVAAVGIGVAVLAVVLGSLPALRRVGRRARARAGGSRGGAPGVVRGTRLLVGAELTLAMALMVGAGLLLRSAQRLADTDVGVRTGDLLTLYAGDLDHRGREDRLAYYRALVRRVEEVPGVRGVALNDYVPFQGEDDFEAFRFPDRPPPPPGETVREEWRRVSEGFFDVAGLEITAGRGFLGSDFRGEPTVAVVNESFARKHWPGESPLGRRFRSYNDFYRDLEVVGTVEDVPARGPAFAPPPVAYVPFQGDPRPTMAVWIHTAAPAGSLIEPVREAVTSLDSSQPVDRFSTMAELVDHALAIPRIASTFAGGLAALGLGLALVGVAGVASQSVRARRREVGIRLALGASARTLRGRLVLEVGRVAVPALVLGASLGLLAGRVMRVVLHEIAPLDLPSLLAAAAILLGAACVATWVPGRRYTRIDPAESLRAE